MGSNFSAQLDQLKKGVNQVSSIVKDTLVVDETWDQENGEVGQKILEEELTSNERQLLDRYQKLEKLYNVSLGVQLSSHRWLRRDSTCSFDRNLVSNLSALSWQMF